MIKIDKNTIWEDTGKVIIHNFPANGRTYSYLTKVYRESKKGVLGWKEVQGQPTYFHELNREQKALAIIMGNAQNALSECLKK